MDKGSMNKEGHHWYLSPYEKYISRGICDCGAIRFFANYANKENLERVEFLNKKYGKEGKPMVEPVEVQPVSETVLENKVPVPPRPAATEPEKATAATVRERLDAARKLRGKKCQTCELSYEHDQQHWCSQKKCPSRLPKGTRLVYRPLPRVKSPSATKVNHSERKTPGKSRAVRKGPDSKLPPLPLFDNTWPVLTQLEWLRTYRELAGSLK